MLLVNCGWVDIHRVLPLFSYSPLSFRVCAMMVIVDNVRITAVVHVQLWICVTHNRSSILHIDCVFSKVYRCPRLISAHGALLPAQPLVLAIPCSAICRYSALCLTRNRMHFYSVCFDCLPPQALVLPHTVSQPSDLLCRCVAITRRLSPRVTLVDAEAGNY